MRNEDLPDPTPITPGRCRCGGKAWLQARETLVGKLYAVVCERCGKRSSESCSGPDEIDEWNETNPGGN
jgi:hypothetical protein